ncbi:ABC transporter permease [Amaricoccus macauensis]|uniref:ABC transporter permease n=1 Tax=Amaricoccus macauensis TaxID=57001 RepID=UPI003C7A2C1B
METETRTRAAARPAERLLPWAFGVPVAAWQIVFFAMPVAFLVVVTFWKVANFRLSPDFVFDNWVKVLGSTPFQRALVFTLQTAGLTTVLAVLLAFPAAYVITFKLGPTARRLAIGALIVPVFSSYILRVYAWQILLSPQGVINALFGAMGFGPVEMLGNSFALQVGLLTLTLPVATLVLVFGLSAVDRTLIEASENLGCPPHRVITNVLIPAVRPAILTAATTVFLLSFGDYVSPVFLGGSRPPTLSILIVDTVKSGSQWPQASVIGVAMLLILSLAFVAAHLFARGRK